MARNFNITFVGRSLVSFAVAVGAMELALFFLGSAGFLCMPLGWGISVWGIIMFVMTYRVTGSLFSSPTQAGNDRKIGWFPVLLVALLLISALSRLLVDFLPPMDGDSMAYALYNPKVWVREGRIVFQPWLLLPNIPGNIVMLNALGMLSSLLWLSDFLSFIAS